jgi:hypothetical protein
MIERMTFALTGPDQARAELTQRILPAISAGLKAGQVVLEIRGTTRTNGQNSMLHSILKDLSEQVKWFDRHLTPEGWKNLLTGHLAGVELVPNFDGTGFVSLTKGKPTSSMTKAEISALFELAWAFGSDKGVQWSPTSLGRSNEHEG